MKKAISILLISALSSVLLLAACGKEEQPAADPAGSGNATASNVASNSGSAGDATTGDDQGSASGTPLLGGWSFASDLSISLTEEDQARFDKAIEGLTGMGYEPVAVVASQLVSGKNYAYLCKTTPIASKAIPRWTIAVVYENLQGEASLTNVSEIDLTDIKVLDSVDAKEAVGAWEIATPGGKPIMMPSEDAQAAFDSAAAKYTGVDLKPLSLLGSQVVAGMNYKYLCYGETVTENPAAALYIVDVYRDLEGNAEITNCSVLDLLSYVTPPVED